MLTISPGTASLLDVLPVRMGSYAFTEPLQLIPLHGLRTGVVPQLHRVKDTKDMTPGEVPLAALADGSKEITRIMQEPIDKIPVCELCVPWNKQKNVMYMAVETKSSFQIVEMQELESEEEAYYIVSVDIHGFNYRVRIPHSSITLLIGEIGGDGGDAGASAHVDREAPAVPAASAHRV